MLSVREAGKSIVIMELGVVCSGIMKGDVTLFV